MFHEDEFKNHVVLIFGGNDGIGKAVAEAFVKAQAKVVISSRNEAKGNAVVEELKTLGGEAAFVQADVSKADDVKRVVDWTIENYGKIDHAFNNAGVLPPTAPFIEMTEEQYDTVVDVDLKGVFLCMKYELIHMLENKAGTIVNTSSVAGVVADPGMAPYVAAKHGVLGLTKAAALEYAASGLRINAVAPGFVHTAMTQGWIDNPEMQDFLKSLNAMGRPAQPEEIVGMVLFLSSSHATFCNGQVYLVDAAQTAH